MSIEDNNILIAAFMGFSVRDFDGAHWRYTEKENENQPYYRWGLCRDLKYHTSWDWLMPVVEKIEGLGYKFQVCRRRVEIIKDNFSEGDGIMIIKEETKIKSVFKGCIEFIQWYNQNSPNK